MERSGGGGGVVARDPIQELGNLASIHIRPVVGLLRRFEVEDDPRGQ